MTGQFVKIRLSTTLVLLFFLFSCHITLVHADKNEDKAEEFSVFITDIRFTGNSMISTDNLRETVKGCLEKEMTHADMQALADRVTLAYQERGYVLAKAFLPEQTLENGCLTIEILEGKIGEVVVEGNRFYDTDLIKVFFQKQANHGVVCEPLLEKALLLANDLPLSETSLVLKQGKEPGNVDIGLKTEDRIPFTFTLDYNNLGTKVISTNRYGISAAMTDPRFGTTLSLRGIIGDDPDRSGLVTADYAVPLNGLGTRLKFSYIEGSYATGAEISAAEYQGMVRIFGAGISHPFIKARKTTLTMTLGWEHKYAEYEDSSLGGIYAKDDMDEYSLRLDFDNRDRFLGRNIVSLAAIYGNLTDRYNEPSFRLTADEPRSRYISMASHEYERILFSLARIQKICGTTHFLLRAAGQYAGNHYLTPLSWYVIGGYGTVRGWKPENQVRGDSGYTVTGELLLAPPIVGDQVCLGRRLDRMVQLALFLDHGGVFIDDPLESTLNNGQKTPIENNSEYRTGWGGGIRLFYDEQFRFKLDVGFPLGPDSSEADNCVAYLVASYNFF